MMQMQESAGERVAASKVLNIKAVCQMTSVSRGSVYAWINDGLFPAPVKLGKRRVGWREADVVEWLESREGVEWASAREAA